MTIPSDKVYAQKERKRLHYIANREKLRKEARERYATNKERIRAAQAKYYEKNREEIRAYQSEYQKTHVKERVAANRKWRQANLELSSKMHRANWLKRRYGISADEWELIFSAQGNRCAICKSETPGKQNWHVDHCHDTGRVRGILCHMCNILLGSAVDDCDNLRSAIAYLIANLPNSRGEGPIENTIRRPALPEPSSSMAI